jgi:hypothetical protein
MTDDELQQQRAQKYELSRMAAQQLAVQRERDAAGAMPPGSPTQYTGAGNGRFSGTNVGPVQYDELGVKKPTPVGATGLRGFPAAGEYAAAAQRSQAYEPQRQQDLRDFGYGVILPGREQIYRKGAPGQSQQASQFAPPPAFDHAPYMYALERNQSSINDITAQMTGGSSTNTATGGRIDYGPRSRQQYRQLSAQLQAANAERRNILTDYHTNLSQSNNDRAYQLHLQNSIDKHANDETALNSNFALGNALRQIHQLPAGSDEAMAALDNLAANPDVKHALSTAGGLSQFATVRKYHDEHANLNKYLSEHPGAITEVTGIGQTGVLSTKVVNPQDELKGYGLTPGIIQNPPAVAVGSINPETKQFENNSKGGFVQIDTGSKKGGAPIIPVAMYLRHGGKFSAADTAAQQQQPVTSTNQQSHDMTALAQKALNDPNASEEHKAAARKILGQ